MTAEAPIDVPVLLMGEGLQKIADPTLSLQEDGSSRSHEPTIEDLQSIVTPVPSIIKKEFEPHAQNTHFGPFSTKGPQPSSYTEAPPQK
jgi:hypothetical protein